MNRATLLNANKGLDQPAFLCILISAFVIVFLKRVTSTLNASKFQDVANLGSQFSLDDAQLIFCK